MLRGFRLHRALSVGLDLGRSSEIVRLRNLRGASVPDGIPTCGESYRHGQTWIVLRQVRVHQPHAYEVSSIHQIDLTSNQCVCVPSLCPPVVCNPGMTPTIISRPTGPPNCCTQFHCDVAQKCPADSVAMGNDCICNYKTCQVPICSTPIVLVQQGSPIPGKCCASFKCSGISVNSGPCPKDSIQLPDGSCICNYDSCPPVRCSFGYPIIVHNYTSSPGNCCPLFQCKTTPQCKEGSFFDEAQKKCICTAKSCRVRCPEGFTIELDRSQRHPDCCHNFICVRTIRCPSDSTPDMDGNCRCNRSTCIPREQVNCNGQQVILSARGTNVPGHCCDEYACVICPVGSVQDGMGGCRCDNRTCPADVCKRYPDSTCCQYMCVTMCPVDSIWNERTQSCTCLPCPDPKTVCPGFQKTVLNLMGGLPGNAARLTSAPRGWSSAPEEAFTTRLP
uniref:Cysteine-rich motor neuron 1 protein n=1 Tax=Lygus hesperus TaxID=30085 RepID=A0A0A9WU76_LYGHE